MLMAVLLLPSIMNLIPLSALAALLICVGIKLASPKEFIHAYKVGLDQFFIFIIINFRIYGYLMTFIMSVSKFSQLELKIIIK